MHLYYAQTIALDIFYKLKPHCSKIKIAGSIRRQSEEVGDIELVLIPNKEIEKGTNLFGDVIRETTIISPDFEKEVKALGTIEKGKFTGRYMKLNLQQRVENVEYKIDLDIFMPQEIDYYRQLAIRTGSANYAKKIATAWKNKGWCGTDEGLRLMKQCVEIYKNKWVLKKGIDDPELPPVWESEAELFWWLGMQYLEPKYRNL